jgi:hypothetical protein
MKSLFNIILIITLVSPFLFGCKKDANFGNVKLVLSTTLSNPIEFEINYRNEFGEYQTEYVTTTNWSKTLDYSKMENYATLSVYKYDVMPNFTGTLQIFKDGVKVKEVQGQVSQPNQNFSESISYQWP